VAVGKTKDKRGATKDKQRGRGAKQGAQTRKYIKLIINIINS
jgi:hypothetical protein